MSGPLFWGSTKHINDSYKMGPHGAFRRQQKETRQKLTKSQYNEPLMVTTDTQKFIAGGVFASFIPNVATFYVRLQSRFGGGREGVSLHGEYRSTRRPVNVRRILNARVNNWGSFPCGFGPNLTNQCFHKGAAQLLEDGCSYS